MSSRQFSDADLTHRWVAQYRIPVVATPYPDWKYEVALVITGEFDCYGLWPGIEPTEDEARIIGSLIDFRRDWYNATWKRKLLERPLDVDSGSNTLVLLKRPDGNWCYRRATWTGGYPLWPPAAHLVPDAPQFPELVALLDHVHDLSARWSHWKTEHPDVFDIPRSAA